MNTRRLLGRGTCAACVSLFLLNDFLCTHLRLDSPASTSHGWPHAQENHGLAERTAATMSGSRSIASQSNSDNNHPPLS